MEEWKHGFIDIGFCVDPDDSLFLQQNDAPTYEDQTILVKVDEIPRLIALLQVRWEEKTGKDISSATKECEALLTKYRGENESLD